MALLLAGLIGLGLGSPARAGWTLVPAGRAVAIGRMRVTPLQAWNATSDSSAQGATWTQDGLALNMLDLVVARAGQPLYRERHRRRRSQRLASGLPPQFALLDLADLFESSFRAGSGAAVFALEQSAPSRLGGYSAIELRFRYSLPEDALLRRGVVRLALVGDEVYAISFTAPALHYFDAGVAEARQIMDRADIPDRP